MAKDTFYFSHDYNPISDPKMSALVGEFGAVGYGVFWRLIEMMHEDEDHLIQKKQYVFSSIAKQMLTSVEQVLSIIKYATEVCELFVEDENAFWSERVLRNIDKRNGITEKRSAAGKASAAARLQQVSTYVEQNPTKERKGKEIKGKEKKVNKNVFIPPTLSEVTAYFQEKGYTSTSAAKAFDYYTAGDWKDRNGKQVSNWKQKMQGVWFKDEYKESANGKNEFEHLQGYRPDLHGKQGWKHTLSPTGKSITYDRL